VKEANSANESGAMLELSQQLTYVEHLSTLKETERNKASLLQLSQFWNLDQATSQDQSTDIGPD
jgi:hypothetical protein